MRDLLKALMALQELEIVLEESRIVHGEATMPATAEVATRIRDLRQLIPCSELKRFDALRRTGPAVVSEHAGTCSGCHLNVPRGDLNRMRRSEAGWVCPNCGRYLLLSC